MADTIKRIFNPKSIALIGASKRAKSVGAVIAKNLFGSGFEGVIMPVNPKEQSIEGVLTYNSIDSLPIVPDLAVICIPPAGIPNTIKELGEKGVKTAVIISAGLGEGHGQDGAKLKQEVVQYIKKYNMRIIGPNCIGIIVPEQKLNASFCHIAPKVGRIGFISQSGAVVTSVVDWAVAKNIGFSHVVSMGDMLDVEFGEMMEYLAEDPNTDTILMYVEAITDAKKFIKYTKNASKKKPIIVIKPGRHEAAAQAAASHTGALAGVDNVYDAVFKRCGVLRVLNLVELFDAVETMSRKQVLKGNKMCILTNGGGIGVLATDTLIDVGGKLAKLEKETVENLNKVLPPTWSHGNPIDIIGDADGERYAKALQEILKDKNIDAILVLNCPVAITSSAECAKAIIDVYNNSPVLDKPPLITSWLGSTLDPESRRLFIEHNIPTYNTPSQAITGFKHMLDFLRNKEMQQDNPSQPNWKLDKNTAEKYIKNAIKEGRETLTEPEAKEVLAAYGIPIIKTYQASSVEEAVAFAKEIDDVIVLKINSPDISHKSDYGGVKLNLQSVEEVEIAANNMLVSFTKTHPKAKILGFSVQQMVIMPKAYELILGIFNDSIFGPVMLFGAGGKAVEILEDKALALPPLNQVIASNMIKSTKIYKLLKGYRDEPAVRIDQINECLIKLSMLARDFPQIIELDINPLLANHEKVIAVDARIRVQKYEGKGNRFVLEE